MRKALIAEQAIARYDETMHKRLLTALLLVLSFLGIADSVYLAYEEITGGTLACNISGLSGCNIVAKSIYSHIFGIPLGVYGIGFFGLVFILGAFLYVDSRRTAYAVLHFLGWFGLLASLVFVLIQFFLIKALCIYCLGSALDCFLICLTSIELWKNFAPDKQPKAI